MREPSCLHLIIHKMMIMITVMVIVIDGVVIVKTTAAAEQEPGPEGREKRGKRREWGEETG